MISAYRDVWGVVHGGPIYDWCFDDDPNKRTKEKYPYSYDAHYLWRDFEKDNMEGISSVYSDRMMQWDSEKYERARSFSGGGWIESISKEAAKKFVQSYYGGKYNCVGFGICCNQSTGYGIGLFFIKDS